MPVPATPYSPPGYPPTFHISDPVPVDANWGTGYAGQIATPPLPPVQLGAGQPLSQAGGGAGPYNPRRRFGFGQPSAAQSSPLQMQGTASGWAQAGGKPATNPTPLGGGAGTGIMQNPGESYQSAIIRAYLGSGAFDPYGSDKYLEPLRAMLLGQQGAFEHQATLGSDLTTGDDPYARAYAQQQAHQQGMNQIFQALLQAKLQQMADARQFGAGIIGGDLGVKNNIALQREQNKANQGGGIGSQIGGVLGAGIGGLAGGYGQMLGNRG